MLDTNVLISAVIWAGRCEEVLYHCSAVHTCFTSRGLLDELHEKLLRKFWMSPAVVETTLDTFFNGFRIVQVFPPSTSVCRDRDDDVVLATAIAGRCSVIITGDKDLLSLKTFEGIRIVSPGDFLAMERPSTR